MRLNLNIVTILLPIWFFALSMSGQTRLGVSAGINFASLSTNEDTFGDDNPLGYPLRRTFSIAINADFSLPGNLWIRLQPAWLEQGSRVERGTDDLGNFQLYYLHLPAMLLYQLHDESPSPYLFAGPAVGYLMDATRDDQSNNGADYKDALREFDFNLNFGAGVEIPLATFNAVAEIQYSLGLNDIEKDSIVALKTSGLRLLVGFVQTF